MIDFDKQFERQNKRFSLVFAVALVLQIFFTLALMAGVGGIIYAAWHFISKYW
jgi:uncharacterized membrane protein